MEENKMRHIGVDLHTNSLTVCYLEEGQSERFETYELMKLEDFKQGLRADDKVAVEATGNSSYFYDQIVDKVAEVVLVAPGQFEVIRRSVSKTDKKDSRALAFFLSKDMLPRARVKCKTHREIASLVETRERLVKLRTTLLNKVHGLCNGQGIKLKKESLGSKKGLSRVLTYNLSELTKVEARIIIEQIQSLNNSILELEKVIDEEAQKLDGYKNITSIKGVGEKSAAIFLSVIGDVNEFEDEGKLAAYFGLVPRVSNSNETERSGRITKRGSKIGRTALVQCALVAKRYSPYLQTYYERIKARRGSGKAIIATARKLLGIIYNTLKNNWVFEDFTQFILKAN
jgi:transposase